MTRKLIAIVIGFSIFLGIFSISQATVLEQQLSENKIPKTLNAQEEYLGWATIIGDGTIENITVNASAENDLVIKTESETSYIDFYIDYSMKCDGLTDTGVVSLLIQLNGDNKGHNETSTFTIKGGSLEIKNVEVQWEDVLTFEIGVVYTNIDPPFENHTVAVGGGVISKKIRSAVVENSPPTTPKITGPYNARRGRWFNISAESTDPDGDDIFYRHKWEFSTVTDWRGPWPSGFDFTVYIKLWGITGSVTKSFQAKDIHGAESDWGYHTVIITKAKSNDVFLLENLIKQFPLLSTHLYLEQVV